MAQEAPIAEIRSQIDAILERGRADESFRERLNAEPEKTLREEGLHADAIGEVSSEIRASIAVRDRGDRSVTIERLCDYTTCWISLCDHWGTFATSRKK